jgi:hypothetical protein
MDLSNTSLGLWGDNPRRDILTPDFFRVLGEEMGFDLVALMIDRHDKDPTFTYKPKHVERALNLADPGAIEVVLTTWPYPDKDQIDQQCLQMDELLSVGPVAAWEVDLEFNWKSKKRVKGRWVNMVHGFPNLDKAGDYLVDKMQELCAKHQVRFEMTSFTQHTENSSRADVAPEANRLLVQAYSVDTRNEEEVGWGSRNGPGRMQKFTLDRTLKVPGVNTVGPRLGVGLAAWDQRFKGHKPEEAMLVALEATMLYNPIDIRWWSSKHIINVKSRRANPYALKFLKTLRNS